MYMKDNKEVKKSEAKVSAEIIKKSLKESWVYHKGLWITGIVILVLIVLVGVGTSIMNNRTVINKITYSFMPKEIEGDLIDESNKLVFYSEMNEEYEGDETLTVDNLLKMYKFYYLDENGEKVYLEDGIYSYIDSNGQEQASIIGVAFLIKANQKATQIKDTIKTIAWIVCAVLIVVAIVVWYIKDKKARKENKVPIVHKKK